MRLVGRSARSSRAAQSFVLVAVAAVLVAVFLGVSLSRLIDGDEGYLLMGARFVAEGQSLYRDVFFTQGPVLPAVFAAFWAVVGRGWISARVLAGLAAAAVGVLVYLEARAATGRKACGVLAAFLVVASGAALGWLPIVKGYGLAALFCVSAVFLAGQVRRGALVGRRATLVAALAGVGFGLSASTRLYVALVLPGAVASLLVGAGTLRQRLVRSGACAAGVLVGLSPLAWCWFRHGDLFLFDVLWFHGMREHGQSSLIGDLAEKLVLLRDALGWSGVFDAERSQALVLVVGALAAVPARLLARRMPGSSAVFVWPPLAFATLLPNPFHPQYLALWVPFLAIEAAVLVAAVARACGRVHHRLALVPWVAVLPVAWLYLQHGRTDAVRYVATGVDVPGTWTSDRMHRWRLTTIQAVERAIDEQGIDEGGSWWPGYFVGTRTRIVPVLANDFGFRVAPRMPPAERARLRIASHDDLGAMIRARNPRLFVEGNWAARPWSAWLPESGYVLVTRADVVGIWVAPAGTP